MNIHSVRWGCYVSNLAESQKTIAPLPFSPSSLVSDVEWFRGFYFYVRHNLALKYYFTHYAPSICALHFFSISFTIETSYFSLKINLKKSLDLLLFLFVFIKKQTANVFSFTIANLIY